MAALNPERSEPEFAEALLRALIRTSSDAIVTLDLDGNIILWNPAAETVFGYAEAEVIGKSIGSVIPDDRVTDFAANIERVRCGESIAPQRSRRRRKNGSFADLTLATEPIRIGSGVVGALHVFTDSGGEEPDFKRLLHAAIVESSDDAIVSKDINGIITSWNAGAEAIFGYSAAEAIGHPIAMIIPPERFSDETMILSRIRAGMKIDHYETVRRRKDGRLVPVSLTISPIRNAAGEVIGASKIARDISDRVAVRQQILDLNAKLERRVEDRTAELVALNQELEAFTYSVAHDLRAPLRGMSAYLQMSREEVGATLAGKAAEYIDMSVRCADRMHRLVEDILRLSKVGRLELRRKSVALNALVDDAREELEPITRDRNIDWRVGPLPTVDCDPDLTRQVFANLLSNAVKYTRGRNPAVIEVRYVEARGGNAILVRDNGVGFDMQYVDRLFTPFERLHGASEFEGTGVGLAIAHRIVRRHGGDMWASGKPDAGADFYFTLN